MAYGVRERAGKTDPWHWGNPVVIFDCNGVLVDSEPLATAIVSDAFMRAGFALTPDVVARFFTGRRPTDMFADVEIAAGRKLPPDFAAVVARETLRRIKQELRSTAHAAHALSWLRGPKCVASSSSLERIRLSLESTDLLRFFEPYVFSANDVKHGKPAPDIFRHVARVMGVNPRDCLVVEDSVVGVTAAVAAGMRAIGFAGGSHARSPLAGQLRAAGAQRVITDMRTLKGTVIDLRGW